MTTIIVQGSARGDGNTTAVAQALGEQLAAPIIDLLQHRVYPFTYAHDYPADDEFIPLLRRCLAYDRMILASPVYWYTMSAQLKVFVDRLTDLLTTHKPLGRQLRGKLLGVLSCANDAEVNPSFYDAFRLTAEYLGMEYAGEWHGWVAPPTQEQPTAIPSVSRRAPPGGGLG